MKVCLDCHRIQPESRCAEHRREREQQRGSRQARGYGAEHVAERGLIAPVVATGHVKCWRCNDFIQAGEPWDLGHDDEDRSQYRGPEHVRCNRATSGRVR